MKGRKRLNYEPFEQDLDSIFDLYDRAIYVFKFTNGFGALVIKNFNVVKEEYEIRILRKSLDGTTACWKIWYSSCVRDSVSNLSEEGVHKCLREIRDDL